MNSKKDFMSEHLTNLNEKIKKCNIQAKNLERLHAEAEKPQPLNLDEVSAAFISSVRVNDWEILGEMFGGYKIGRIYSYILNALNERIEDSTAATIRVDVPLYEQCPTIACKCGGKCKHNESKSEVDEAKEEMTLIKMENEVLHCRAFLREIQKTIYNFGLSPAPQNVQNEVSEVLQSILKSVKQGLKEEEE